eukprot:Pgem_evm2s1893
MTFMPLSAQSNSAILKDKYIAAHINCKEPPSCINAGQFNVRPLHPARKQCIKPCTVA